MSRKLRGDLHTLEDRTLHCGANSSCFEKLRVEEGIVLPSDHEDLLKLSNGIEAYAGYVRLFGIHTHDSIDMVRWNECNWWKFAWGDRSAKYWCFAETAWGDQYAYLSEALQAVKVSKVYFLDAFSMRAKVIASSFSEFFEGEFLRQAKQPYDAMTVQSRRRLGPLELCSHLVYTPSLLLGGAEDIAHVQKMNARAAMICNGDIALQIEIGPAGRELKEVRPYEDEMQRARLRLVWA